MVSQFADIDIQKEEVPEATPDSSKAPQPKTKCTKIKLKETLKNDKSPLWKELCIKNFDFIKQEITSCKDLKCSAAKFARYYDKQERLLRIDVPSKELYKEGDKLGQQMRKLNGHQVFDKFENQSAL